MALYSFLSKQRAMIGPAVATVGVVVTLIGSFSSWLSSGRIGRSSFELLAVIQRLGFVPNGPTRTLVRAWPLMPLVLIVGIVLVWWGWRVIGAGIASIGAVYAGAVGGAVAFAAPDARGIDISAAPQTTFVGALVVLFGSLLTVCLRVPSADANP